MANYFGVVSTVMLAPPQASTWLTAGYINGREKCMLDYYVGLGTEVAGSKLYMGDLLPVGAKVITVSVSSSAATGGLTFSVGDLDLATRYANAGTGIATAGITTYNGCIDSTNGYYVIGTNPATPTATDNDRQIVLTTGGATLGTGTIYGCRVVFVTD